MFDAAVPAFAEMVVEIKLSAVATVADENMTPKADDVDVTVIVDDEAMIAPAAAVTEDMLTAVAVCPADVT